MCICAVPCIARNVNTNYVANKIIRQWPNDQLNVAIITATPSSTQFIMHYARQDLLWLKYHLKVQPKNVFCTKVASKIARTASSAHGYKDLVKELCGKDISKKEQQSDWGNPNLSTKQINYAAQDTEYLFEIKNKLITMLKREKRIDLFENCMKVIPILVDMEMSGYKLETFAH